MEAIKNKKKDFSMEAIEKNNKKKTAGFQHEGNREEQEEKDCRTRGNFGLT